MVVWITGLSGAGKSTLAAEVVRQLRAKAAPVVLLDGDEVRAAIGDPGTGHDRDGRLANAMRICRFAKLFESQGLTVVVATMSLFHEVHEWNRANLAKYLEVLVQVELATVKARDPKGHYKRGENVPGVDLAPELPKSPDLVIPNDVPDDRFAEKAAALVIARL